MAESRRWCYAAHGGRIFFGCVFNTELAVFRPLILAKSSAAESCFGTGPKGSSNHPQDKLARQLVKKKAEEMGVLWGFIKSYVNDKHISSAHCASHGRLSYPLEPTLAPFRELARTHEKQPILFPGS